MDNDLIEELYKTLEAKDKIINEQVLELARYQGKIDKAIEYIKENKYVSADENCEILAGWRIDELLEMLGNKE